MGVVGDVGNVVPADLNKLARVSFDSLDPKGQIVNSLREDKVALVSGVSIDQADALMLQLADEFGLKDELELQVGFASLKGHRSRLSRCFMTANQRKNYQCLPPHCEGNSFTNIQMVAFYCYENTTDGGETILLNIDSSSPSWVNLRERVQRGVLSGDSLTAGEVARVKMQYNLKLPEDMLREGEDVVEEMATALPSLKVVEVLSKPKKTYSKILGQELNVFWSSIENTDVDSAREYEMFLRHEKLFRESASGFSLATPWARVWSSGLKYSELFKSSLTYKLRAGEFIVLNNQTWAHAVNNWTPESGVRKTAVALA